MSTIINLHTELLIDRSRIRDPYLRLLLTAIGEELVSGSPWVAVNKTIASQYRVANQFLVPPSRNGAALAPERILVTILILLALLLGVALVIAFGSH